MKKVILAAILIPLIIAGCIVNGTVVYIFDLAGEWIPNGAMQSRYVNLSDNSDFQDNKDKLKSVDSVVLVGDIINMGNQALSADVYISDYSYTTPAQVIENGTQIFSSPTIGANDTLHINWKDGLSYITNLNSIEKEIKGDGQFYVYAISSSGSAIIYDLNLVATLTIGL
jgi:hypothetical protein